MSTFEYLMGTQRFESATMRAFWQGMIGHLRGKPAQLLSFDEVKTRLRLREESYKGLQEIPVKDIVGSVGRYREFTRTFLPKPVVNKERWSRIYAEMMGNAGLPPIEVYQVGAVYFVRDGNHRVSVARELGQTLIQAYVTQIDTPFGLSDLMLKSNMDAAEAYMAFLDQIGLRRMPEEGSLQLSEPSRYSDLLGHLHLHWAVLCETCGCDLESAVAHWYETVYLPAVNLMREYHVLRHAQGRTEADMYLWLVDHLQEIEGCYSGQALDLKPGMVSYLEKRKLPVPEALLLAVAV